MWLDIRYAERFGRNIRGTGKRKTRMILFFRIAVIYFALATAWNFYLRDDLFFVGAQIASYGTRFIGLMTYFGIAILFFALWSWLKSETTTEFVRRVGRTLVVVITCCCFLAAFTSVKSSLPYAAEHLGLQAFFADPFFAELDRALHFGTDPWVWTHQFTQATNWDNFAVHASLLYGPVWVVLAFYLPAIMMFAGEDARTFRHYTILYAFSWIVLGNVFALIGQSGGPIFYDLIFGTTRFAELTATIKGSSSVANSWFGDLLPGLWNNYINQDQSLGAGISAFPSLHVAMIAIVALYFAEKHLVLRVFGVLLVIGVLFVSVWIGFHYAIDGYFSMAVVFAAHLWLKRRDATRAKTEPSANTLANA